MNVRWTNTALGHLASIYEYIARDSARYAQRMADAFARRADDR